MSFSFLMPDIGEGVVEGEVISWLKKVGETVKKDEPILVLMTDKATVELPTPYAGTLAKIYYKPGDIAKKGLPLFDIATGEVSHGKPLASPAVRKQARDLGVSLETVKGSGPEGRVLNKDLEVGSSDTPLTGIRRLMAKKMEESHVHIPPFSYFEPADATRLVQLKDKMQPEAVKEGLRLTFMPYFIKALSLTLTKHPLANCSLDEEKLSIKQHASHHIGIAMKTPLGLIVPIIKDVDKMTLVEIVKAYDALKLKAQNNQLLPSDMKGATITITNFGALSQGADYATPIINYPEVAILGLAHIHKEPVVRSDALAIAPILHCSWSFDHRVIDGDAASEISRTFVKLIENPASLL
jgi:pyruvate/2-oxoglutarate dehydrogenase complex dihydrolipoamide acyltransferase (E2) component